MPDIVFVWTIGDAVTLFLLAVMALVFSGVALYDWNERRKRKRKNLQASQDETKKKHN